MSPEESADRSTSKPKAPAGLGQPGRALWRQIASEYELDPQELLLLVAAARQQDDIVALERLLHEQGPTVIGSTGQPRLNPAFAELRQARLALARLLDGLALPVGEDEEGESPVARSAASRRAQKAALARHDRERNRRDRVGLLRGPWEAVGDGA